MGMDVEFAVTLFSLLLTKSPKDTTEHGQRVEGREALGGMHTQPHTPDACCHQPLDEDA